MRERRQRIHDLYQQQLLQDGNARFVRSFEMRNKQGVTDYFLFFATNNSKGLEKMKDAMWKVDPAGMYVFSDATVRDRPVLLDVQPDFARLRREIRARFAGQTVGVEDVERLVVEETAFRASHYKTQVLAPMERSRPSKLGVFSSTVGRRRGTFPSGIHIRFS